MTSTEHSRNLIMAVFCLDNRQDRCATYISTQESLIKAWRPNHSAMLPNCLSWVETFIGGKINTKRLCDKSVLVVLGI